MASTDLNLKSKLDDKGFKKAKREAGNLEKFAVKSFAKIGVAAGAAFGAQQIAEFTKEAALLGSANVKLTRTFNALVETEDEQVRTLLLLEQASKGLLNENEQLQLANTLFGLGLVETGDQLSRVITFLRRTGGELKGLPLEQAADQFASLISNRSLLRLDNIGIKSSSVKAKMDDLGKTMNELTDSEFLTIVLESAEENMARLGEETFTTAERMTMVTKSVDNLQTALGQFGQSGEESTTILDNGLIIVNQAVIDLTEDVRTLSDTFITSLDSAGTFFDSIITDKGRKALEDIIPLVEDIAPQAARALADGMFGPAFGMLAEQGVSRIIDATNNALEEAETIDEPLILAEPTINEVDKISEETSKRFEKLKQLEHDFAMDVFDIQRDMQSGRADAWDDFFKDEADAFKKHEKNVQKIMADAAKSDAKSQKDHQRQLDDLAKQEQKDISDVTKKTVTEEKNQRKRSHLDELLDQRLFDFELRQLAAEGEGNRIAEMLERREIELEIAKEKANLEEAIETDKRKSEIETIRQTSSERRQNLQRDFAEENAARKESLAEQLADEDARWNEQRERLVQARNDELIEIDKTGAERLALLAENLVNMRFLAREELDKFVEMSGRLGAQAGQAFVTGMTEGFSALAFSETLTGQNLQAATNIQNNVPVNINGFGGEDLRNLVGDAINDALQQYTSQLEDIFG